MGIDQLGSRFAETTAKRKRAATNGITSWECMDRRHFKCREECVCDCHSKAVPKLKARVVAEDGFAEAFLLALWLVVLPLLTLATYGLVPAAVAFTVAVWGTTK